MNDTHLKSFVKGFIEGSKDDTHFDVDGERVCASSFEFTEAAEQTLRKVAETFASKHSALISQAVSNRSDFDYYDAGRALWFSQVGEGCGFWDQDLGVVGDQLESNAQALGSYEVCLTENKMLSVGAAVID